jgi:PAS domain S-box-containing protein
MGEFDGTLAESGATVKLRMASVPDADGRLHTVAHFISAPTLTSVSAEPSYTETTAAPLELLLTTDTQGRIQHWSPLAEEKFGWSHAEMTGQPVHRLFRPSDGSGFYASLSLPTDDGELQVTWPWFGNGKKGEATFLLKSGSEGALSMQLLQTGTPAVSRITLPQRKQQKAELPDLGREKLLLMESHHRIKNHLQILSSLLNLQSASLDDAGARQALRLGQNRIRAIASLHQHLQDLAQARGTSLDDLVRQLVGRLAECHGVPMSSLVLQTNISPVTIREEWMLPVVLIVNEAISNSLEHAFGPDGATTETQVRLSLHLTVNEAQRHVQLSVQDDGVGLPNDFIGAPTEGLGLRIINIFADQLRGSISLENLQPKGMRFLLTFPVSCLER